MSDAAPPSSEPVSVADLLDAIQFTPDERLERHGEIARGGMASVETAVDRSLGRRVALKLIHAPYQESALAVRSFIREAQITGQLDHPNIVPVHELRVDHEGRLFFTMKLVEGHTLLDILNRLRANHRRVGARGLKISTVLEHDELLRLVEVFLRVLDAIAFAHSRGVVHCDIKAENVMVGDFGQVYLMDWGIARLLPDAEAGLAAGVPRVRETLAPESERSNFITGTPAYMSPEQARGERHKLDLRSDIFALGAMLYEILTGHPPYQGLDSAEELALARDCQVVLLPHLPIARELRRIISVAMHPDPAQRFASVELFRAQLRGFMRGGDNFPRRRFRKDAVLIHEGEQGDAAYILVSGRCEVCKLVDGKRQTLRTLGPGDVFGETAILAASCRTASVIALTEVVAVVVTAQVLDREVDAMKPWMGSFIRALARRFTDVDRRAGQAGETNPAPAPVRADGRVRDPAQIANLALMNLQTWGRREPEGGLAMSAIRLCESVAKVCGLSEDEVLEVLREYAHFDIVLTQDQIALPDPGALARELSRFL